MCQRRHGCTEEGCPATVRLCAQYAWCACGRKKLVVPRQSHAMRCGMNGRTLRLRQQNKESGDSSQENRRMQMQRNGESLRQMRVARKNPRPSRLVRPKMRSSKRTENNLMRTNWLRKTKKTN
ncbi:hypothetical protein IV203_003073 [Nitzschia inconspicua]|uniref:Uncharacterized protein n=1 Tax=Nitzschia inconspicua TaxID=303405 RepID=A0A9K3L2L8_9STRA|nr:hypothetical protein IV203_003073 [Nitzschia inconspicua]